MTDEETLKQVTGRLTGAVKITISDIVSARRFSPDRMENMIRVEYALGEDEFDWSDWPYEGAEERIDSIKGARDEAAAACTRTPGAFIVDTIL